MQIHLNGQPHYIDGPCSLAELLEALGLAGRPVVAELNESAVLPRDYPDVLVSAGARLELITIAAGG